MAGSFPVEIGWSLYGEVHSVVIRPHETWNESMWDRTAQSIHGHTLPFLRRTGLAADRAARKLNERLRGSEVFSDNTDRDVEWTDMLFSAAGMAREFEIRSIGPLLASLRVGAGEAYAAFRSARDESPPAGSARQGVRHLQAVLDALQDRGLIG